MNLIRHGVARALLLVGLAGPTASAQPLVNILRNGSFERSLLYWHNVNPQYYRLVRGDAPVGEFSLRIEKEYVMSAPFAVEPGWPFTLSFSVKGDREGEVRVQMAPRAREEAVNAKRLRVSGASQQAKVGTQWQRVSFTAIRAGE